MTLRFLPQWNATAVDWLATRNARYRVLKESLIWANEQFCSIFISPRICELVFLFLVEIRKQGSKSKIQRDKNNKIRLKKKIIATQQWFFPPSSFQYLSVSIAYVFEEIIKYISSKRMQHLLFHLWWYLIFYFEAVQDIIDYKMCQLCFLNLIAVQERTNKKDSSGKPNMASRRSRTFSHKTCLYLRSSAALWRLPSA